MTLDHSEHRLVPATSPTGKIVVECSICLTQFDCQHARVEEVRSIITDDLLAHLCLDCSEQLG